MLLYLLQTACRELPAVKRKQQNEKKQWKVESGKKSFKDKKSRKRTNAEQEHARKTGMLF